MQPQRAQKSPALEQQNHHHPFTRGSNDNIPRKDELPSLRRRLCIKKEQLQALEAYMDTIQPRHPEEYCHVCDIDVGPWERCRCYVPKRAATSQPDSFEIQPDGHILFNSTKARIQELNTCRNNLLSLISVYEGLLHPIRRSNVDLLQLIFEWAVAISNSGGTGPGTARAISQVCRRWRSVALSTPRLWTQLTISFTPHCAVSWRESWNQLARRVKSVPARIIIDGFDEILPSAVMPKHARSLARIPHISSLRLVLNDRVDGLWEALGVFHDAAGRLDELHIDALDALLEGAAEEEEEERQQEFNICSSIILSTLPEMTCLRLSGITAMGFTEGVTFPTIVELILERCRGFHPLDLVSHCPSLRTLSVVDNRWDEDVAETTIQRCVALPHLTSIHIAGVAPFPWGRFLICLKLTSVSLAIPALLAPISLMPFELHQGIRHVELERPSPFMYMVAAAAPDITSLRIHCNQVEEWFWGRNWFLHLEELTIVEGKLGESAQLTTDTLEWVIASRCSPRRAKKVTGAVPEPRRLKKLIVKSCLWEDQSNWRTCTALKIAPCKEIARQEGIWLITELSW